MKPLEIELSYLEDLLDEDVQRIIMQCWYWQMLNDCAAVFDLDVANIEVPFDLLPKMILRKADEHLSEAKADAFKRVWKQYKPEVQIELALTAEQHA